MELTQLKYFQTVAQMGSVSRAAQELYVTQPNLSRSIARLEKEIGVPLFEHRKGKIVLNDYGRIFLSSVDICLSELSTGVHAVKRLYDADQNNLSIGGSVDGILADMLIGFSMKYPEIGIRQFDCSQKEMREKLLSGDLDLGITGIPVDDETLVFKVLDEKEYVILVGGKHPLAKRERVSLSELKNERFICSDSRVGTDFLQQICENAGFGVKIAFEVESNELIYSLLEENQGIACMPVSHISKIQRDYPDSDVKAVSIQEKISKAQLGILYRKNYQFSHAAKQFSEFVEAWLQSESRRVEQLITWKNE